MKAKRQDIFVSFLLLALLAALPLVGMLLLNQPIRDYLEFPPTTRYVAHAPFFWPAFLVFAVIALVTVLPFLVRVFSSLILSELVSPPNTPPLHHSTTPSLPFPLWGWFALAFGVCAWVLAWTRFPWFAPLQPYTFSPLWFAYIVVVNALTYRRTGRCMMLNRTGYFLCLFVVSAAFWWFFEYLNRFVQNWYYVGATDLTPLQYFIFATLPFSTVLPAVLGTYELLASFPATAAGLDNFVKFRVRLPKTLAAFVLAVSGAGLACIGILPDYLFPLLWVSPLCIIVSLQALRGQPTIFAPLQTGDWRRIFRLALAALICGWFWEMWNFHSMAKWIYAVPFVGRFHIFEMPLVGYTGYLPFGLECAVIGDMVMELVSKASRKDVHEDKRT